MSFCILALNVFVCLFIFCFLLARKHQTHVYEEGGRKEEGPYLVLTLLNTAQSPQVSVLQGNVSGGAGEQKALVLETGQERGGGFISSSSQAHGPNKSLPLTLIVSDINGILVSVLPLHHKHPMS